MKPRCYVDLRFGPRAAPTAAALALGVLHGVFRQHPGQYALALPDYPRSFPRLRVFAGSREALDRLVAATDSHAGFSGLVEYSYPKTLPDGFAGPWISYRRYRIPSRKAERNPDANLRLRRMQAADTAGLPYFVLHSQSNRQVWRLYVQAQPATTVTDEAEPDAYGLATASRPFGVPHLP